MILTSTIYAACAGKEAWLRCLVFGVLETSKETSSIAQSALDAGASVCWCNSVEPSVALAFDCGSKSKSYCRDVEATASYGHSDLGLLGSLLAVRVPFQSSCQRCPSCTSLVWSLVSVFFAWRGYARGFGCSYDSQYTATTCWFRCWSTAETGAQTSIALTFQSWTNRINAAVESVMVLRHKLCCTSS